MSALPPKADMYGEYTRDTLLSGLEEARQLALRLRQASAAVQASMGKAKILGLIIDRAAPA